MREMDAIHLRYPFYGSRRIKTELGDRGFLVNRNLIRMNLKLLR